MRAAGVYEDDGMRRREEAVAREADEPGHRLAGVDRVEADRIGESLRWFGPRPTGGENEAVDEA